jgi:hypothetical protein
MARVYNTKNANPRQKYFTVPTYKLGTGEIMKCYKKTSQQ